jgi:hypothetical protein
MLARHNPFYDGRLLTPMRHDREGRVEWGEIYDSPTSMPIFQPRCSDQKWVVSCGA